MKTPIFNNSQIQWLYENDFSITPQKLETILALPRTGLIADLETVLTDSITRLLYFEELLDEDQATEETFSAPLHALFLLGELKATESLPTIFEIFKQDDDFLDLWFVDHLTETLWEPIYKICETKPSLISNMLFEPETTTFARAPFAMALCQIVLHQPNRRAEIIEIFNNVIENILKLDIDSIDKNYNAILINQLSHMRLVELLPAIKQLHTKNYINLQSTKTYTIIEQEFKKPLDTTLKLDVLSIGNRYAQLTEN